MYIIILYIYSDWNNHFSLVYFLYVFHHSLSLSRLVVSLSWSLSVYLYILLNTNV